MTRDERDDQRLAMIEELADALEAWIEDIDPEEDAAPFTAQDRAVVDRARELLQFAREVSS